MRVKTHHIAVSMFVGAIALGSFAWLNLQIPTALATCSSGAGIAISSPPSGTTLSGTVSLNATTAGPTEPTSVTFSLSAPTQTVLGDASPSGTNPSIWPFQWNTTTVPDGGYQLIAVAHYGSNTAYDCPSAAIPVNVTNSSGGGSQQPTLTAAMGPEPLHGAPGDNLQFSVSGVYTNQIGVQYPVTNANGATFQWGSSAGQFSSPITQTSTLTVGNYPAGTYRVGVLITMDGLQKPLTAAFTVDPPNTTGIAPSSSGTPLPSPTATPPAPTSAPIPNLTPAQIQVLEKTPTIFRPPQPTNADPVVPVQVLGCIQSTLGSAYSSISNGTSAPSISDRLKADACFSGSNKIPSVLAPVNPSQISTLVSNNQIVTVSSTIKNETIQNGSTKVKAIVLSGTGTPSSDIFLYVFSNDPMVLRAQTDSQGHWSYVLENPLKPGQHKVYAVSQSASNNFVRTSALPFAVAAAAGGSSDGNLVVQNKYSSAQIAYVAGAILLVIVGIFMLFRVRRNTRRLVTTSAGPAAGSIVMPQTTPPDQPAPPSPNDSTPDSDHDHPA
jgi:hypothetical protein